MDGCGGGEQLSNLCQAFSKKIKVLNTHAFSLIPASRGLLRDYEPSDAIRMQLFEALVLTRAN